MRILQIRSTAQLVIADVEVMHEGEPRSSATLCALLPADDEGPVRLVPLSTPDGRPVFMNPANAIALDMAVLG